LSWGIIYLTEFVRVKLNRSNVKIRLVKYKVNPSTRGEEVLWNDCGAPRAFTWAPGVQCGEIR